MSFKTKILITNDDGITAPGVISLLKEVNNIYNIYIFFFDLFIC